MNDKPKYLTTVISVIAVADDVKLDCCDEELHHVWVEVTTWSPRRAYLTGALPFLLAAGCEPQELEGRYFVADLPANPPSDRPEDTVGERLEWRNLQEAPPIPEGWLT